VLSRDGSTSDGRAELGAKRGQLLGLLERRQLLHDVAAEAGRRRLMPEPRLVAAHARRVATAASSERLTQARDICDEALLHRGASTDDGWTELRQVRNRIAGQLTRRQVRPSGEVDGNGNPVPLRRHHPDHPDRTRPGRFSLNRWARSIGSSVSGWRRPTRLPSGRCSRG